MERFKKLVCFANNVTGRNTPYRVSVNVPVNTDPGYEDPLVLKIINQASKKGAGDIGAYSHVAFMTEGIETWHSEEGANPHEGKIGETVYRKSVRVEMQCPRRLVRKVVETIARIHPYEEPVIEVHKIKMKTRSRRA